MDKLFNSFKRKVMYDSIPEKKQTSVDSLLFQKNLRIARIAGILFFLINLYYLISDIVKDFYKQPHAWPNLIAILLLMVSSVMIVIVSLKKRDNYDNILNRIALNTFYLLIIVSVTIFAYTLNIRALEQNASKDFIGITLSTCYLLLLIIAPLPKLIDGVILMISMFVGMIILMIVPGKEMFDLLKQLSFRIVILIAYIYFYRSNKASAKNVVEISSLNNELLKSSYIDTLTGALNRNAMNKYTDALIEKGEQKEYGILMFDLDDFKTYNDTYSHVVGDEALKKVCEVIGDNVLNENCLLFRFGGEEFILLTTVTDKDELVELGKTCKKAIYEAKIKRNDDTAYDYMSISVGCAVATIDDTATGDFITKVDDELYFCKTNGKNCVSFNKKIYK